LLAVAIADLPIFATLAWAGAKLCVGNLRHVRKANKRPASYGEAAGISWPLPPGPIASFIVMTYVTIAPSINTMAAQNHQL
jgi:hypothetical protein